MNERGRAVPRVSLSKIKTAVMKAGVVSTPDSATPGFARYRTESRCDNVLVLGRAVFHHGGALLMLVGRADKECDDS